MKDNTPCYGAWLPANVRYDKDLPANAKLIYAELTSLSNLYGYAFATNLYLAELYNLSEDRISKLIHILEKKGYIKIDLERNENGFIVNRKIWIEQKVPALEVKNTSDGKNNPIPSVKITTSDGKNNPIPSVKITTSDGKNNGNNNNTNNDKTINNKTINNNTVTSNPFPEPEDVNEKVEKKKPKRTSSKTKIQHLLAQEEYTKIFNFYKSAYYSLFPKDTILNCGRDYKSKIDSVLIHFRELGINDKTVLNNMLIAIQNAKTNQYIKDKNFPLNLIIDPSMLGELSQTFNSSNNVNKNNKHYQIDYLKCGEDMKTEQEF